MQYSLVVRDLEREHVPLCRKFGLGILPWSPLAGGSSRASTARTSRRRPARASSSGRSASPASTTTAAGARSTRVRAVAEEKSTTPAAVSLAWLLAEARGHLGIFGARSIAAARRQPEGADVNLGRRP